MLRPPYRPTAMRARLAPRTPCLYFHRDHPLKRDVEQRDRAASPPSARTNGNAGRRQEKAEDQLLHEIGHSESEDEIAELLLELGEMSARNA